MFLTTRWRGEDGLFANGCAHHRASKIIELFVMLVSFVLGLGDLGVMARPWANKRFTSPRR